MIDTNLLLYAANSDADEHLAAVAFLTRAAAGAEEWYLSDGILYEFLRVATHPKVFAAPLGWRQAMQFLAPLIAAENFRVLTAEDGHWNVLTDLLAELTHPAGNLMFDVRTAVLMREHGIRTIYTTDTDFLQFPGLTVVNPLRD